MKKTLITAILFTVSFSSSFAQLSKSPQASFRPREKLFTLTPKPMYGDRELAIGGHVSFMKLFSANTMIGIGVNGLFSSDGERNAYFGDISQFFGGKIVLHTCFQTWMPHLLLCFWDNGAAHLLQIFVGTFGLFNPKKNLVKTFRKVGS